MGTTPIVTPTVWTSQNDVALTPGNGITMLEKQMQLLTTAIKSDSYILSGATVPANSGTLTIAVAAGSAYVNGFYVTWPNSTTVTCAASNTNYIWLQLTRDGGGLVNGLQFNVNITGAAPDAYSYLVATAVAGVGTITSTIDTRLLLHGRKLARRIVYTANNTFTVPGGVSEIRIRIWGAGGGGGGGGGGATVGCANFAGHAGFAGGHGGYTEGVFAVNPGGTYAVTIGTGGGSGGGGAATGANGVSGGNGTTTSVGALCSATAGQGSPGGMGAQINVNGVPSVAIAEPGVGVGGDLTITGGGSGGGRGGPGGTNAPGAGGAGGTGVNGQVVIEY